MLSYTVQLINEEPEDVLDTLVLAKANSYHLFSSTA